MRVLACAFTLGFVLIFFQNCADSLPSEALNFSSESAAGAGSEGLSVSDSQAMALTSVYSYPQYSLYYTSADGLSAYGFGTGIFAFHLFGATFEGALPVYNCLYANNLSYMSLSSFTTISCAAGYTAVLYGYVSSTQKPNTVPLYSYSSGRGEALSFGPNPPADPFGQPEMIGYAPAF